MTTFPTKVLFPLYVACASGKKKTIKEITDSVSVRVLETKDESGRTPLIICIANNQTECATILLKAGVHVNNTDTSGQTALHIAVKNGFHRSVKLLLSHKANCLQKDFSGVTSLHMAAIHTNSKCLNLLLKEINPGEVDIQDSSKRTALHWSSSYLNLENTKVLLIKKSNIYIPDVEGKTPLHWAAISPNPDALDCVKILLDKEGTLINWQDYEGRTALHLAVATGSTEVVRFLVCRGDCNVDILDNSFCTPLHWAAKRGFYDKVDILLNGGACFASVDGNLASPLHYAAFQNSAKTVEVFLSRNYVNEKDARDENGRSALIWAAAQNANNVVSIMAEKGVDLVEGDPNGITALHAAAVEGHVSTVELLLKLEVPIDLKDKYGLTPLLRACEVGSSRTALFLLNNGADIHITDANNRTALHWCALGGHPYVCQVLLQKGAKCSAQDIFGMSPLHYACMGNGHLNCVSVLLESGRADVNCTNIEGKTPLHYAVISNHLGVIRLLCEYDANVNAMALKSSWVTPLDLAFTKGGRNIDVIKLLKKYGALRYKEIENIAASKIQKCYQSYKYRTKKYTGVFKNIEQVIEEIIEESRKDTLARGKSSAKLVPSILPVQENTDCFSSSLETNYFKNVNFEPWKKSNHIFELNKNPQLHQSPLISNAWNESKDDLTNSGILRKCKQNIELFQTRETAFQPPKLTKSKDELTNSAILQKCKQNIELFQTRETAFQSPKLFGCLGTFEKSIFNFPAIYENVNSSTKTFTAEFTKSEISTDIKTKAAVVIQNAWRKHAVKIKFKRIRRDIQTKFKVDEDRACAQMLWHIKLGHFYNQW
ncbi:hypothetical protein JTE90_002640 [Oedothorax gibbosus]|uniref:Alpha-latrotoxin n=1 Tax=Oedothorax gibbosus TaxID=931172 RepID=A0AAV6VIE7_9ARAC|nr:hypothetical protein JTE90_002640 [Oedothorax gibbosus]